MAFPDQIVAGDVLIRDAIQSDNYDGSTQGWRIERDGDAFFFGNFSVANLSSLLLTLVGSPNATLNAAQLTAILAILDTSFPALQADVATIPRGLMALPVSTSGSGTATSGTTETRDSTLSDYVFTANANSYYEVTFAGLIGNGSVVADTFNVNIRDGTNATPSLNTLIATNVYTVLGVGGPGRHEFPLTWVTQFPAGTVTLRVYAQRTAGTGVFTPLGSRQLYVKEVLK